MKQKVKNQEIQTMKTEEQIKEKLEKVVQKRLEQRFEKYLSKNYRNCKYNLQKEIDGNEHCFCTNIFSPIVKNELISICENNDCCENCKLYECKHTEDSVKNCFIEDISNPSICGIKEPKIAVLLWVLKGVDKPNEENDLIEEKENNYSLRIFSKILKMLSFRKEN